MSKNEKPEVEEQESEMLQTLRKQWKVADWWLRRGIVCALVSGLVYITVGAGTGELAPAIGGVGMLWFGGWLLHRWMQELGEFNGLVRQIKQLEAVGSTIQGIGGAISQVMRQQEAARMQTMGGLPGKGILDN